MLIQRFELRSHATALTFWPPPGSATPEMLPSVVFTRASPWLMEPTHSDPSGQKVIDWTLSSPGLGAVGGVVGVSGVSGHRSKTRA